MIRLMILLSVFTGLCKSPLGAEGFHDLAQRPPLGWNSWDCFGTTVTEAQTRAQADYLATHLKPHGWEYIVVDIQWYEPGAVGFGYRRDAPLTMDGHGRLLPAENRFPSAASGAGFKPLADYVHSLGLKFGVHLLRGIPRQAVEQNLPILGTTYRAADIADRVRVCEWNPDMFGVDMAKPGAQAYYDSVFALIASWGVDFVKVDDLSQPYHENEREVEAIRLAMERAGRPMVLSLSPGETPLSAATHVAAHANLWRISDDFWDNWPALRSQFARLEQWNPHRRPGAWPDADMLPLGRIKFGRSTRFSRDEQRTLLSLWAIARSPLMHGGDLTKTDDWTLSLLTNDEMLAVNQQSENNQPLFNHEGLVAWVADVPGSADKYLAVFNTRSRYEINAKTMVWRSRKIYRDTPDHKVPIDVDIAGAACLSLVVDNAGDGRVADRAMWLEPRLVLADGSEQSLLDQAWAGVAGDGGEVAVGRQPDGTPLRHGGRTLEHGIGANPGSRIDYDLPPGAVRFRATGALDDSAVAAPAGGTVRFSVYAPRPSPESAPVALSVRVMLDAFGFRGPVQVRDLWTHRDLGVVRGEFAPEIPWHGAGLYRLTAQQD